MHAPFPPSHHIKLAVMNQPDSNACAHQSDKGVELQTNEKQFPVWKGTIDIPKHANIEFKYAIRRAGSRQLEWEQIPAGKNRQMQTGGYHTINVDSQWGVFDASGTLKVSSKAAACMHAGEPNTVDFGSMRFSAEPDPSLPVEGFFYFLFVFFCRVFA
jgi:hypothetical protein